MLWSAVTRRTATGKIADGPVLLFGLTFNAGSAGNGVLVYNDTYDNDNELMFDLEGSPNLSSQYLFDVPVLCNRGLYVKLDENTDDVSVLWRALPEKAEG